MPDLEQQHIKQRRDLIYSLIASGKRPTLIKKDLGINKYTLKMDMAALRDYKPLVD